MAFMSASNRSEPMKGATMNVLRNAAIELETTTHAVLSAHDAYHRDAIESVGWERRGLLQRLARVEATEPEGSTSDVRIAA